MMGKVDEKKLVANMLRFALIEIRASDDLTFANRLADVFHNMPNRLIELNDSEDQGELLESIRSRAERLGLGPHIAELERSAKRSA